MPKTFSDGTPSDYSRLSRIMAQYHQHLVNVEARVSITFVRAFDKDDEPMPSLKFAGANALATVKLVSQERKLRIPYDAEIKIDGFLWDEKSEQAKDALLDHELTHIQVKLDANGIPIMDDTNHAKLKIVPDDIVLTGFFSVIRHYGNDANEYQAISRAMESASQALTDLLDGAGVAVEATEMEAVEAR